MFLLFLLQYNQTLFLVPGQLNPPTLSSSTTTSIILHWDDLLGSAMKIYTVIQDGIDVMTGINTNMATVNGLTSNTNYRFQVKASNSAGDGQISPIATFATSKFVFVSKRWSDCMLSFFGKS